MKLTKCIFIWWLLITLFTVTTFAQTKKEKQEKERQELKEVIDSYKFSVDVNTAYPRRGKTVYLTSPYSLEVKNDSLVSWLPYYGRAYSVPYGGGEGLIFKTSIDDYNVEYTKKGAAKIILKARTKEDTYKFIINIYPGGLANIDVTMVNRDGISFTGQLIKKR